MNPWLLTLALTATAADEAPLADLLAAIDAPSGLGLEAVAARALETAPQIDEAQARRRAAAAQADQAVLGLVPRVELSASYTRISNVDNPRFFPQPSEQQMQEVEAAIESLEDPAARQLWRRDVERQRQLAESGRFQVIQDNYVLSAGLSWSLTQTFFSAREALAGAGQTAKARELEMIATRHRVLQSAAQRYYSAILARGRAFIARDSLDRNQTFLAEVRAQVRAGAALDSARLRAEARAARARGALARARAARRRTARNLQTLMHRRSRTASVALRVELPVPEVPTFAEAEARALEARPELAAAEAGIAAAEANADRLSEQRIPDLSAFARYRYARPNPRVVPPVDEFRDDWQLGARLSWSPTRFFSLTFAADAAEAEQAAATAELRILRDRVRDEVAEAHANARASRAAIPAARAELRAARAAYRVRREQFRLGAATLNDVVDAETDVTRAQVGLLRARVEASLAELDLRRAVGRAPVPVGEHPRGRGARDGGAPRRPASD